MRNNPLNLVDPLGKKGRIKSKHDEKTNTTTISIDATFAVYGANGQGVSQEDLQNYAAMLKSGIESHFNKEFTDKNGRKFVISASVNVEVKGSEKEAATSGMDNIVELGYGELSGNDAGVAFHVKGEKFDRMAVGVSRGADPRGSLASMYEDTFAHEFGSHLLNGGHNRSRNSQSLFYDYLGSGQQILQEDFEFMFREKGRGKLHQVGSKPLATYEPLSHILTSTSNSFEVRQANSVVSKPSDVYNWSNEVRK